MSAASESVPATDAELARLVAAGIAAMSLPLEAMDVDRLVRYVRLIEKWTATYNLTAIRDPREMVTQHVSDCLAAAGALLRRRGRMAERLLDVGSGAGLPGLVIAMLSPERTVVCVDSVGKKTAFIAQAAGTLSLKNVTVRHSRVERLNESPFDVITSRALASLSVFVEETRHLVARDGVWMAMKGKMPEAELNDLQGVSVEIEPLYVPGLAAERCLVWIAPSTPGSERTLTAMSRILKTQ